MAKNKFDGALVEAIIAGQHPASAWLEGRGSLDGLSLDVATAAIEAAVRQQHGTLLDALNQNAADKKVRKAAAAALHRLKSMGVTVAEAPRAAAWSPRAGLDAPPQPVALLGFPDPSGYFPFILLAYGPQEACVSVGLAGAGQGFTDANHGHLSRSDARDMLRRSAQDQGMHEVPFHVGLHFVQRAFEEARSGEPHGFEHMLDSVPRELRESARLIDPLEGQEAALDADALHTADAILDPSSGLFLALPEEDAYRAIISISALRSGPMAVDEAERAQRAREAIDKVADEYLTEIARRTWALALDVVTFLAWRSNNEEVRRAARHNALALRAGHPGSEVPFVHQWINTQIASMTEMFFQGVEGLEDGGEPDESGIVLTDG